MDDWLLIMLYFLWRVEMKKGFDNNKYVKIQSEKIRERFKLFVREGYELHHGGGQPGKCRLADPQ